MPAVPTKQFDVRQGNNCVDADGTTYPRATVIVFRDNNAKDKAIDAITSAYGWNESLGTKQQFFNKHLQDHIKAHIRNAEGANAALVAQAAIESDLP